MDILIQEQINSLNEELQRLLPLSMEQQTRLNEKFELEFNYNSNHIEGNTLTYIEIKQFLQFDETDNKHTLREYEEMKASELALELIKELATDKERPLTEAFIKSLNQVLLVRPYWKEALTPDGQNTRRKILVGEYKSQPNSVLLANGKMFDYASPAETPMLMHELLDWYRSEEEKKELHPVELAALLHYKFVCIHPFDDGNGRISRLLMNYVLYKNELPPIVVKTNDKSNYRRALHDADSGDVESFINYIAEQFVWSLELSIKAAKNESLEEGQDWKKRLNVLKKDLITREGIREVKSPEIILNLTNNKIIPLIDNIYKSLSEVRALFMDSYPLLKKGFFLQRPEKTTISIEEARKYFPNNVIVLFQFENFRHNGINCFPISIELRFDLEKYMYTLYIDDKIKMFTKLYHQNFTQQDIESISDECGKILIAKIEQHLNNSVS